MTHNSQGSHKALEEYFHKIVSKEEEPTVTIGYEPSWILVPCNQPKKEKTMFERSVEYLKNKWIELTTTKYKFTEEHETLPREDYWAFEIHTGEWVDEFNELRFPKHDVIIEANDATWCDVLDQILDVMGEHYGYNIKEQVYYAVEFPTNDLKEFAGHGRKLNYGILQQLLLAFPEVYDRDAKFGVTKNIFEQ